MFVIEGTAHQSLQHQWCIIEQLSAAQQAEIAAGCFPDPPAFESYDEDTSMLALPPQRADALADLAPYSSEDWDSDGARAVSQEVVSWSNNLLDSLPETIPNPDVAPASSGSICMEWAKGGDLVWADVEPNGTFLTLTKFAGVKSETLFDVSDEKFHKHLATALIRLYS